MKIGLSLFLLVAGITVRAQLPVELSARLAGDRAKDDLSTWIYDQLQYVAKAPADRSGVLVQAAGEAWRRPRTNEEVQAWLDLLTNEGYALLLAGSIVPSTDAYTAAYEWARHHHDIADEGLVLETILKPLGNNYTRLGDYEQALFIHRKALALASVVGDKQVLAGVYSNLTNTCSNMGRFSESLDYCRLGLSVADKHSALYGVLLSEQADAYLRERDTSEAKRFIGQGIVILEEAYARKENPSAGDWLLMAYQQAGDIYISQPLLALNFYNKALTLQKTRSLVRQREKAKLFFRLGSLYTRMGRSEEALSRMDECLSILVPGKTFADLRASDLYAENTLADLLFMRGELLRGLNADEALRFYGLSFAATGKLRQELISGSSREQVVEDTRSRYERAIGFCWNTWEKVSDKKYLSLLLDFMESSKSQLLLEEQVRVRAALPGDSLTARVRLLEKALSYYEKEAVQGRSGDSTVINAEKQISWELAQLRKNAPDARKVIGEGTVPAGKVVRSFFCGSDAVYALECSPAGISFAEKLALPGSWQDSLRAFIHHWFGQGANAMIDHPSTYYREALRVYHDLFGHHPLKDGVDYILLPDGALNLLPVDALVTKDASADASPADWPFVVRDMMVSYGWSLRTLKEQDHHTAGKGISGFFVSGNVRATPSLRAVEDEKKGIQKLLPDGHWYIDSAATTERFRRGLVSSSVVHVSSHAFSGAEDSSIRVPRIELYNAPFYLFELRGLESQPELVVLGACRTGDGRMVTGEGVQSLARAFTGGGANAVIAGWWNVDDETAARLMEGFYLQMKDSAGEKENAARALRAAKVSWLKDPTVPYLKKLPYYWAALNYQGNPQPLKENPFAGGPGSGRYWWSILLLVIIWVLYRARRSGKLR